MKKNKMYIVPIIIDTPTFRRIKSNVLSCVLLKTNDYDTVQKVTNKDIVQKGVEIRIINIGNGETISKKLGTTQILETLTKDSNLQGYYMLYWKVGEVKNGK